MIFCVDKVADALNRLYHGVEVDIGGKREMVRAMVTQYRGDWKFHRVSGQHLMDLLLHAVVQLQKKTVWISLGLRNGSTYKHGGRQSIFAMGVS